MQDSLRPLSLEDALRLQAHGAQLVDVRDGVEFAGDHLRGVLNVGLRGKYATWAGTVLNHEDPIVVIADGGSEEEAVMRLGRIGYDNVQGFLEGGMSALAPYPELLQRVERITAHALHEQLESDRSPVVLDVRTEKEREETGFIEGSLNIPLNQLRDRIDEVPVDQSVVVHCAGGYRSSIACSLLQRQGHTEVRDLVGGFQGWVASRLPVAEPVAVG